MNSAGAFSERILHMYITPASMHWHWPFYQNPLCIKYFTYGQHIWTFTHSKGIHQLHP